jgi:FkbM family methyltransferase
VNLDAAMKSKGRYMSLKNVVKDCLPPIAVRAGRRLLHRLTPSVNGSHGMEIPQTKTYRIGSTTVVLPIDHALPPYQSHWRLYDMPLKLVANAVREHFGTLCAIDIGANVGDSAALINAGGPTPVLCIEGDPAYLPFLEMNAKAIGPDIVIETCFVGPADGSLAGEQLERHDGTTIIRGAVAARGLEGPAGLAMRRLDSILQDHATFRSPHLLKIDTDGYDFSIILSHLDYIAGCHPVLFFEYLVESEQGHAQSLECIRELLTCGYQDFLVFDNFGNCMLRTSELATFEDLNEYLHSNRKFGKAVYYLDVCAIPTAHREIVGITRAKIAELLK